MHRFKKYSKIKKINILNLCCLIIMLCIVFFTVGFSAHQVGLDISNMSAEVRVQRDIRIMSMIPVNSSSSAVSNWEDYNVDSIYSGISLPYSDSTVTYNVSIVNVGNMEASISDIVGLPSNLTYTLNNYNLRDMMCDDNDSTKCKLGSNTTISITIGYATNGYDSNNVDYTIAMDVIFSYMVDSVAMIDNALYDTLQGAVGDVPDDKTETIIKLLNSTSEVVQISSNKNIVLNLNGKTLSNDGNNPIIANSGILQITNGTMTSDALQGAINNESTGTIIINGARVVATGGRQALYNNKGVATITGSSYLTSDATERGAVQNLTGGTLNILGGTIISTGLIGVVNEGTLTIGVKDGNVDGNYPVLQGIDNGLNTTTNVKFYDGVIKGANNAINTVAKIVEMEVGYGLVQSTETIGNTTYDVVSLGISNKVTFNGDGGTVSDGVKYVVTGERVGTLPTATKSGYELVGWFTQKNGNGTEITTNTIITAPITFYAHWNRVTDVVRIGNTYYDTVQEAITAAPSNTQVTLTLLKDMAENISVSDTKDIIFDLNGKTLSNNGNSSVVENSGNLTFINGTLTSSASVGAINNNAGRLTIGNGARIVATGTRQAIYINDGIVEITGTAYLSSQTNGKPTGSSIERGTIQCLSAGTLIVTGGTIEGTRQQAISNEGTLTIGVKDGTIDSTTPVLNGSVYGVKSTGTFNFYDGIIRGKTAAISGTITDQEVNSSVVNGKEKIGNVNYKTVILQIP